MRKRNLDKNKFKICIIGSSKYFFSGLSAHTIFLSNALSTTADISVILLRKLLPGFLYPGKAHLDKNNYVIGFKENLRVYDGMDWCSPISWWKALLFLNKCCPDAIIMLWWTSSVAHMQLLLILAGKIRKNAKLILEVHEVLDPLEEKILPVKLYSKLAGRILMGCADAFTVHSESTRELVSARYHIDKTKIFVKPFGLYEDYRLEYDGNLARKELGIAEEFVILNFGSVRKYKGVRFLVEAFSALPDFMASNSRLIIAGEDWGDDRELHHSLERSRYKFRITFVSRFIDDKEIPKYFSSADVVVLPYINSCGSGVAHIAMSYGKPILTSDIETMKECLKDYSGAYFALASDSMDIKNKLVEIFKSYEQKGKIIHQGPKNSWNAISDKYIEIIKNLNDEEEN